ncbi:MAG: DUF1415 domain-containing protein [Leptolyngbyaceae bacterium]|nr:DUF1415 domain-containing protein [Leptolyngbyaceae bacterium]
MAEELERSQIVQGVRQWLEQVVIGLNLCPFVIEPWRKDQLRIRVSDARTEQELLTDLHAELALLDRIHPDILDTSLLVLPYLFPDFEAYNEFLTLADLLLQEFGWDGDYQIASFHPSYRFDGTEYGDPENLTNCSPYPILHILREHSVSLALANYPNPEQIPERNIQTVQALDPAEKQQLFPFLTPRLHDCPPQYP